MHPSSRSAPALWLVFAGFALQGTSGCSSTTIPSTGDITLDLKHVDPRVRIQAVKAAAEGGRADLLLEIAANLSDADPAVRMFTAVSLRKLTGQDFDFKPHGTMSEREEAIARWLKWIEEQVKTANRPKNEEKQDGQVSKQ